VTSRYAGATLAVLPEPTVVTAGADHHVTVHAEITDGGRFLLREELVLGRYGECGGRVTTRTTVEMAGEPLLRHEVTLDGADPLTGSPAVLGAARAYGTLLVCGGPARRARHGEGWAAMPLAGPGMLVTAVAATAGELRRRLGEEPGCTGGPD
jgi:urease accessory protein